MATEACRPTPERTRNLINGARAVQMAGPRLRRRTRHAWGERRRGYQQPGGSCYGWKKLWRRLDDNERAARRETPDAGDDPMPVMYSAWTAP